MNSTDDGATWGAESTLFTEASTPTYLAAVAKSGGTIALIYNIGDVGGGTGATVKALRRSSGGVWTGPVSSPITMTDCFGVAVCTPSTGTDFGVAVTGHVATALPRFWSVTLTDAGPPVWGSAVVLEKSDVPIGDRFFHTNPYLLTTDRTRIAFRRQFVGNVSRFSDIGVSALPLASQLVTSRTWREALIADRAPPGFSGVGRDYGMALSSGGSYMWLTSAGRVYRAPSTSPSLDLTADVLALDIDWKPGRRDAHARARQLARPVQRPRGRPQRDADDRQRARGARGLPDGQRGR